MEVVITSARATASRMNGKKGGVKTIAGKLVSRRNALKHGILSHVIKGGVGKLDVALFHEKLAEEYKVASIEQQIYLEEFVCCFIRLKRCAQFESEMINETLKFETDPWVELNNHLVNGGSCPKEERAELNEKYFQKMELVFTRYQPQLQKRMDELLTKLAELRDKAEKCSP